MGESKIRLRVRIFGIWLIMACLFIGCGYKGDEESSSLIRLEDMRENMTSDNADQDLVAQEDAEEALGPEGVSDNKSEFDASDDETLEVAREVSIVISVAGDVTLGTTQQQDYYYSFDQEYDNQEDKVYFFQNVLDVFEQDDLTYVNLEGPLTTSDEMREDQTYCIKGRPEYVKLLQLGSIEACGFANNHRLDYGVKGSDETVALLEENNIAYAYDSKTDMVTINKDGNEINIGLISVNEINWGGGVEKLIQDGIEELNGGGADLILVMCHWGIEREFIPENYQTVLGRKCIDWGADMVIGAHPHVLQGIESYKGKYIIYSLGNFCFGANRNPEDKDTMIVQQEFTFVDGVKQDECDIRVFPCSVSSTNARNNFQPTVLEGAEAARVIGKINELSTQYGVIFDSEGRKK